MKRLNRMIFLGFILAVSTSAMADVADDVIALTKAQWQAQIANAPASEAMKSVADDYTEFNDVFPTRLDGKSLNMRFAEAYAKDAAKVLAAEMANPKVQVYGDVAILTYNYLALIQGPDGAISQSALKSTRVYAKKGREWMLVHANFAPLSN
jgi:ketosteroid isomerase-like protein